jgi:uncharacterized membrane protein YesL
MYYLLLNQTVSEVAVWLRYPLVIITIIYIVFLLYVFPVFVHYEMKIPQILKTTFLIMSVSPLSTIMLIAAGIILYFTMSNFPGLIPLFGGSLIGFIVMWSSYLAFSHLKRKEEKTVVLD